MKLPVAVRASDGKKYFSPVFGPATFQLPRVLRLQISSITGEDRRHRRPAQADLPLDARPGEAVQDEEPDRRAAA